jgi:hypothetical protein
MTNEVLNHFEVTNAGKKKPIDQASRAGSAYVARSTRRLSAANNTTKVFKPAAYF